MDAYKVQTETTFNVTDEDGNEYTVTVMEDYGSGHISWDITDDEGNMVIDDELVTKIANIIEPQL
jgi:hypothetical protein